MVDNSMDKTINVGARIEYEKIDKIKRGDIVVFRMADNNRKTCLRVVGFPGERIEILQGKLYVNGNEYTQVKTSKSGYTVFSKTPTDFTTLKKYDFKPYSGNYGMVYITKDELNEIKEQNLVDSIYDLGFDSTYVYPEIVKTSSSKYFNHYYFGPIFIPVVGDAIKNEDKMLFRSFKGGYDKSDDYYFCIGDGFSDAMDSRVLGLIPSKNILGKVSKIENEGVININVNR